MGHLAERVGSVPPLRPLLLAESSHLVLRRCPVPHSALPPGAQEPRPVHELVERLLVSGVRFLVVLFLFFVMFSDSYYSDYS